MPKTVAKAVAVAIQAAKNTAKARKASGSSRFLNSAPEAVARRSNRVKKREDRKLKRPAAKDKRVRTGSRAGALPCCGKRPERCPCWGEGAPDENRQVMAMLDKKKLKKICTRLDRNILILLLSISKLPNEPYRSGGRARVLGSTSDRASSLCQHEQPLGPAPIELASTRHRASSFCQHEKPLGPAPIELASTKPPCRLDWLARCCCQRQLQRLAYR